MQESAIRQKTERGEREALLPVYAVTPFTMLDFPGRTACIVWFSGCNMRCAYCHNPQIVKGRGRGNISQVMEFLTRRRGLLDGIVLSGGEATVWPGLPDFIKKVKAMGFAIKLDTNGLRPEIVGDFLDHGFLDFVALDYKAPPTKFKKVTGIEKYDLFHETLSLLSAQKKVPFEVRTTVHTALLDEDDVISIIEDLKARDFQGTYAVQNFRADNGRPTLGRLPPQKRTLDLSTLPSERPFKIECRNFP